MYLTTEGGVRDILLRFCWLKSRWWSWNVEIVDWSRTIIGTIGWPVVNHLRRIRPSWTMNIKCAKLYDFNDSGYWSDWRPICLKYANSKQAFGDGETQNVWNSIRRRTWYSTLRRKEKTNTEDLNRPNYDGSLFESREIKK